MKRIVRYTPSIAHSDFLPHLLEHCICHPDSKEPVHVARELLQGSAGVDGDITYFEAAEYVDAKDLKHYCQRACLEKKKIAYEYEVFKEEFDTKDYKIRVYDKFMQQTFDKKWSSSPYKILQKDLQSYFETYYRAGNPIVYDTETLELYETHDTIVLSGGEEQCSEYRPKTIVLDGEKNYILYCETPNLLDLHVFCFLENLCDAIDLYYKRYSSGSYYRHSSHCVMKKEYAYLRLSPHIADICDAGFIERFKQIYSERLAIKRYYAPHIRGILYRQQHYSVDAIIAHVQSIDLHMIRSWLGNYIDIRK